MHEFSSNRETQTYRYGAIETPFLGKDQNTDRELGAAIAAIQFWKILSLIGLACSFLLLLFIMLKMVNPNTHVLYAEVLPNGFVQSVGWLTTQS